jgi:uncharacterized protein (TIGR02996 family)
MSAHPHRPRVLEFLHACKDDPNDDAPRLILADWLQDQDDPRGELIRLQCRLWRLPRNDARRPALERLEEELRARHEQEWKAALGHGEKDRFVWLFRGLSCLTTTLAGLTSLAQRGLEGQEALAWLEGVQLGGSLTDWNMWELARCPVLGELTWLDVSGRHLGDDSMGALAASAHVGRLKTLMLSHNTIRARGAEVLASSPCLAGLDALDLEGNPLGDMGAHFVVEAQYWDRLSYLNLRDCALGNGSRAAVGRRWPAALV